MMRATSGSRRLGSAALDLAYVAAGRFDGFWERELSTWDMAAGMILIREAGGIVRDAQGGNAIFETGSIVAGNDLMVGQMLKHLNAAREAHAKAAIARAEG